MRYDPKWESIIAPILQGTDIELVGALKTGGGPHVVLRVYIDKQGGITIDDIARVSREIDMVLSVEMGESAYTLEVSSPGLDRLLLKPNHFQQKVGEKVKIKLSVSQNNRKTFIGLLEAANEESATVVVESETFVFPYSEIDEARIVSEINFGKATKKEAQDE